jgi:hypothetical protein
MTFTEQEREIVEDYVLDLIAEAQYDVDYYLDKGIELDEFGTLEEARERCALVVTFARKLGINV